MTPAAGSTPGTARHDEIRTSFSDLIARWQSQQHELDALAHEAQALLERQQEDARDAADRLMIDARIEAARLLTEARREVAALRSEVESLRQAQREAAQALQQTRRALDVALGRVEAPHAAGGSPPLDQRLAGRPGDGPAAAGNATPTAGATSLSSSDARTRPTPGAEPRPLPAAPPRARGRALVAAAVLGALVVAGAAAILWTMTRKASDDMGVRARASAGPAETTAGGPIESAHAMATPAVPVAAPQPASAAPLTVVLEARRSAWVRATVDGTQEAGRTMTAGQTRRIAASREILVRAGDAGALVVSVNGGASVPFGRDGEVRTRRFGDAIAAAPAARGSTPLPAAEMPPRAAADTPRPVAAAPPPPAQAVRTSGIASPPPVQSAPIDLPQSQPAAAAVTPVPQSTTAMEQQILTNDRLWFDGFYRGDGAAMARVAAPGFEVVDGRARDQKPAPGATPERILSDVRVDIHGDGAVLSGRMIERVAAGGAPIEHESFVSQVWVRRDGTWKLLGLRLAGAEQVRQAAGSLR